MSGTSKETKLVELRRRTDRDLLILVQRQLDRALTLADVAATKHSPLYTQAERAYMTARALLPTIAGVSRDERRELENRLTELQAALDRLPSEKVRCYMAGGCEH